jgi:serine/threonine protein kinase
MNIENGNNSSEGSQTIIEEQIVPEKYRHRSLINKRYIFEKKIGSGSFGSVYRGKNVISDEPVAIKFEATTTDIPTLLWESKILNQLSGTQGVVKLRYFGTETNKNIIVMDLFSHTLCDEIKRVKNNETNILQSSTTVESSNSIDMETEMEKRNYANKNTTTTTTTTYSSSKSSIEYNMGENESDISVSKTVHNVLTESVTLKPTMQTHMLSTVKYMISMIEIIERVHEGGIVHRDIKPENFMISCGAGGGAGGEKKLHIIDFGLSRFYMKGGKHVSATPNASIVGTIRYISTHIHEKNVYTRRDDIISIIYVAIYLARGSLPWSGLIAKKGDTRSKDELVYEKKIKTTSVELCQGIPSVFQKLLDYSYSVGFEDKPDYVYMIRQCKNFLKLYI